MKKLFSCQKCKLDVKCIQTATLRYTDSSWREREEDKSLEGLLTLARREIEQEKQLKKVRMHSIFSYLL